MKVIPLFNNQQQLIKKLLQNDRSAQKELFTLFAPKMMGVCRQYIKDLQFAQEVMLNGFLKAMTHLKSFENKGSFEGWIRRIMINECISFLRQQKPQLLIDDNRYFEDKTEHQEQEAFEISDLQQLVDNLPNDFKLVFNLFAIEGLSHKDISNTLKISEQASRLRLFKARTQLKEEYSRLKNATNGK